LEEQGYDKEEIYKKLGLSVISLILCIISFYLISFTYIIFKTDILEIYNTVDIRIKNENEGNNSYIIIQGFPISGVFNVKDIKHFFDKDSLILEVQLTILKGNGLSGNINEKILVEKPYNHVLFGKNRAIIWSNGKQIKC